MPQPDIFPVHFTGWQVVRLAIQEERTRDMVGVDGYRQIESPDTAVKLRDWLHVYYLLGHTGADGEPCLPGIRLNLFDVVAQHGRFIVTHCL